MRHEDRGGIRSRPVAHRRGVRADAPAACARSHGFECHSFSYPHGRQLDAATCSSVSRDFVERIDADRVHFVGHSLGGLVLYRYFESATGMPPGRVVFLGSPTVKSRTAERVGRLPLFASLIGRLVADELVQANSTTRMALRSRARLYRRDTRRWASGASSRASTRTATAPSASARPNYPGHTAHLTLPVSHMGMLLSADVARQVGEFLASGRFSAPR